MVLCSQQSKGVGQGKILSMHTTTKAIYIDPLLHQLEDMNLGVHIGRCML